MQRRSFLKHSFLSFFSMPYFVEANSAEANSTETRVNPDSLIVANTYFSAAKNPSGQFSIQQIDQRGKLKHNYDLPSRGHSFAVSDGNYLVAIGRRPANFFLVIDLRSQRSTVVYADIDRRFYGHGVFSPAGEYLYLTENDLQTGMGKVGVYLVANGFKKIKEFSSFGIGPHDIAFDKHNQQIVIANGGIKTHPATGRKKLNIESMQSSLVHIDPITGEMLGKTQLANELRFNSIRHLALDSLGNVYISLQNQKPNKQECLLAIFNSDTKSIVPCEIPITVSGKLNNYLGDICLDQSEQYFMATSPRGDQALIYDSSGQFLDAVTISDVCGVAKNVNNREFTVTSGSGLIFQLTFDEELKRLSKFEFTKPKFTSLETINRLSWDNHLLFI